MPKARRGGAQAGLFRWLPGGVANTIPRCYQSLKLLLLLLGRLLVGLLLRGSLLNSGFLLLGHSPSSKKSFGEIRLGDLQVTLVFERVPP